MRTGYLLPHLSAMLQRLGKVSLWRAAMDAKLVQATLGTNRFFDRPVPVVLLPTREVFLQPLLRGAFPTNVPAYFFALDPLVLLYFLLLGSKHISERVFFSMS
jgi:hypothetical protein